MKVAKFGGSSVATADQIRKVVQIIKSDLKRKFIVVSAPGVRFRNDTKVTDLLISYYQKFLAGLDYSEIQQEIIARYHDIAESFQLDPEIMNRITQKILGVALAPKENNDYLYDLFLAQGEDNCAYLVAEILRKSGLNARYVNPQEAGIIVTAEPHDAQILPSSYPVINKLNRLAEICVIPGFFGYTQIGEICTFSRGGSDITGSIVAAGVEAEIYENFTDVDGIFAAHPGIVHKPQIIKELTYREMRELAYAGFGILHNEALFPVFQAEIPIVIKNTNNPEYSGTRITNVRSLNDQPVVGIASASGFASINLTKFLMNREVGFVRKILSVLEKYKIRFEHIPSGIDDLSIIIREKHFNLEQEADLIADIKSAVTPDEIHIEHGLSIIMIVGEGMNHSVGVTATGTFALSSKKINLGMINQGSSEVSVMFGIQSNQEARAVRALYHAYFED